MNKTLIVAPIETINIGDMIDHVEAAKSQGADLVELRVINHGNMLADISRNLCHFPLPVIIKPIPSKDYDIPRTHTIDPMYDTITRMVRGGKAKYIDIEYGQFSVSHAKHLSSLGAKIICSYHNYEGMNTLAEIGSIIQKMIEWKVDIAKIAVTANDANDLHTIRYLYKLYGKDIQLTIIAMGDYGVPSRLLAGCWGAAMTYVRLDGQAPTSDGKPLIKDLLDTYRFREQDEHTRIFGVVGNPLTHTLSPLVHNELFRQHRRNGVYVPFLAKDVKSFWWSCKEWISGLSVTMPFKSDIIHLADSTYEDDKVLKCSNTVIKHNNITKCGNSDCLAIESTLASCIIPSETSASYGDGPLPKDRVVLILGAGSMARNAILACMNGKAKQIYVTNRTFSRAKELEKEFKCRAVPFAVATDIEYDILINCTSVGMATKDNPFPKETPWPKTLLRKDTVVLDTVYRPYETQLLLDAKEVSGDNPADTISTISGINVFLHQATYQAAMFELAGVPNPTLEMYNTFLESARSIAPTVIAKVIIAEDEARENEKNTKT